MNLKPLFEMQRALDDRIIKEKGLEGQGLLPEKILALQVELGELANEWRGFKFWSEDREPRVKKLRGPAMMDEDKEYFNPLLEEYVDCLHFILSIGITLGDELYWDLELVGKEVLSLVKDELGLSIVDKFNRVFVNASLLIEDDFYISLFASFLNLGESLGFTWEQIEQAYKEKNATNHLRQSNGY